MAIIKVANNNQALSFTLNPLDDMMFYKVGDTLTYYGGSYIVLPGLITSSSTGLRFSMTVPKNMSRISSVNVTAMTGTLRGPSGYLNSDSSNVNYATAAGYTVTAGKVTDNVIRINIDKDSAFTNVDNNVPVVYYGGFTIKFS